MHEKISSKGQPLLPLNALRAFEAIARHMSFARAAEELHVTPAALSHQIRGLEEQLGLPLFTRHTRAIERIAGRAIMRIGTNARESEFAHVGLGDDHGTGRTKPPVP